MVWYFAPEKYIYSNERDVKVATQVASTTSFQLFYKQLTSKYFSTISSHENEEPFDDFRERKVENKKHFCL